MPSASSWVYGLPERAESAFRVAIMLLRNLPLMAVRWSAGAVWLNAFLSAPVELNTVLMAGRPIRSTCW